MELAAKFKFTVQGEEPKAKPKAAKQFFQQLDSMGFDSLDINAPGNVYRFIAKKGAVNTNRVVWEANTEFPVLDSIYQQLNTLIKVD